MKTKTRYIHSNMKSAPVITNQWGDTTNFLDAVLVNGFNTNALTSLIRLDDIVTGVADDHGFEIGQVIRIEGAVQSEYNGDHRVTNITTNTFSFQIEGAPPTPATGTITAKTAPLGWEIVFSATNKRVYRNQGTRGLLRVDNSMPTDWGAGWSVLSRVTISEEMSDIDTFIHGRAPFNPANPGMNEGQSGTGTSMQAGWFLWPQSAYSTGVGHTSGGTGAPRPWKIMGDGRTFYWSHHPLSHDTGMAETYGCGDYSAASPLQRFPFFLAANERVAPVSSGIGNSYGGLSVFNTSARQGKVVLYGSDGLASSVFRINTMWGPERSGQAPLPVLNPTSGSLVFAKINLIEDNNISYLGDLRGIRSVMNNLLSSVDYHNGRVYDSIEGSPEARIIVFKNNNSFESHISFLGFEISDDWET